MVDNALASGGTILSEPEAKAILPPIGFPPWSLYRAFARRGQSSGRRNDWSGGAERSVSTDIAHKSDVGGVALNLSGAFEVEKAANVMLETVARKTPEAQIQGFTVQTMAQRPGAQRKSSSA